jgi:hypothetical protein
VNWSADFSSEIRRPDEEHQPSEDRQQHGSGVNVVEVVVLVVRAEISSEGNVSTVPTSIHKPPLHPHRGHSQAPADYSGNAGGDSHCLAWAVWGWLSCLVIGTRLRAGPIGPVAGAA